MTRITSLALALALATPLAAACRPSNGARGAQAPGGADTTARAAGPATAADSALFARADSARIQGSPTAPVWVVEVGDFQCPYCARFHEQTYPTIKRDYIDTGKIRFAYVNLPLDIHPNAWPAAEAAMCAGLQGKFWPMHDAIFQAQDTWGNTTAPRPVFDSLAVAAGVDTTRLNQCVESGVLRPLIQADANRSSARGVNSTPTFFIGNQTLRGALPLAEFRRAIDAALAAAARDSSTR